MQQTNQITTALGALTQQNCLQYEEAKQEKDNTKVATVEKILGKDNICHLLMMTRVLNKA